MLRQGHRSFPLPALKTLPSGLCLKLFSIHRCTNDTRAACRCATVRRPFPRYSVLPFVISILVSTAVSADMGTIVITGDEEQEGVPASGSSSAVPFAIGDTAEGEFTGFREVIEKEQLQQAGSSLAEVVAAESGVQFKQSGGLGSHTSVSLRGSSAEQVNVYLDGILLNEASGGGVNFSDIELMTAEKVEVYKGTVPVQLGNTAIGGAINITTARASKKPVVSMLAGFGSFGSTRFSAAFRGPGNLLNEQSVVGSFSFRQSANDFPFLNDNGTQFNTDDDQRERRHNAQARSVSGFVKTGHTAGKLKFEHALQMYDRAQGIANWRNSEAGTAKLDSDHVQWRSTVRNDAGMNNWSSLWEVTGSVKNEVFDDSNGNIGNASQLVDSDTQVFGVRNYWEKVLKDQSLFASFRLRNEAFESINRLVQINATKGERIRADASVQYNQYFNDAASLVSASVVSFGVKDDYEVENVEQARQDYSSSALLPQIGISHTFSDQWVVLANLSRQKRVPSFFELFGSQGLFVGNSSLQTETSNNFDVGFKWTSDAASKVDAAFSATYFYGQREDLIVRVFNAQGVGRSLNLSRAVASGLELGAAVTWAQGFSFDASLTLQETENQSRLSGFSGRQLPGEAAVDSSLKAGWKNQDWKFEYEFKVNSDRFYDGTNLLPAADQRSHGLTVSRSWQDWRFDLELNNLTDRNYEDFNGYPKPGRVGFISLYYQPK